MFTNMVAQITPGEHVHHKIEVLPILESIVHVDDEGVVELCENLPLVHYRLDTTLGDYTRFRHLFHGVGLLSLLTLDLPHLAKTTLADAKLVVEVGFG